jgi:hypothetical protein
MFALLLIYLPIFMPAKCWMGCGKSTNNWYKKVKLVDEKDNFCAIYFFNDWLATSTRVLVATSKICFALG